MSELTPQEIAGRLDKIAILTPDIVAVQQAASIVRKVANGQYVKLECKEISPNGLRDCAGSRDEWFQHDFCEQCQKYYCYGERKDGVE